MAVLLVTLLVGVSGESGWFPTVADAPEPDPGRSHAVALRTVAVRTVRQAASHTRQEKWLAWGRDLQTEKTPPPPVQTAPAPTSPVSQQPTAVTVPADLTGNRLIGQRLAAERGWVGAEWGCLDSLWRQESGWDHTADNPNSAAYGIPQALPGSKMGPGWQDDPRTQVLWGLSYVASRYQSPCSALAHHASHGWY